MNPLFLPNRRNKLAGIGITYCHKFNLQKRSGGGSCASGGGITHQPMTTYFPPPLQETRVSEDCHNDKVLGQTEFFFFSFRDFAFLIFFWLF